jgi:hypothetical protein
VLGSCNKKAEYSQNLEKIMTAANSADFSNCVSIKKSEKKNSKNLSTFFYFTEKIVDNKFYEFVRIF